MGPTYPGPINSKEQVSKLCILNDSQLTQFLPLEESPYNNFILKTQEVQEDVDYKLMPDQCFEYLYRIYGGNDIRRYSIESLEQFSATTVTESTEA